MLPTVLDGKFDLHHFSVMRDAMPYAFTVVSLATWRIIYYLLYEKK